MGRYSKIQTEIQLIKQLLNVSVTLTLDEAVSSFFYFVDLMWHMWTLYIKTQVYGQNKSIVNTYITKWKGQC